VASQALLAFYARLTRSSKTCSRIRCDYIVCRPADHRGASTRSPKMSCMQKFFRTIGFKGVIPRHQPASSSTVSSRSRASSDASRIHRVLGQQSVSATFFGFFISRDAFRRPIRAPRPPRRRPCLESARQQIYMSNAAQGFVVCCAEAEGGGGNSLQDQVARPPGPRPTRRVRWPRPEFCYTINGGVCAS